MLLFHEVSFSKLKCFIYIVAKFFLTNIWINIVKKRYNLIYTGIFSDSQNFRRVISISLNSELVPDYLIVTLLPPGGVFRF